MVKTAFGLLPVLLLGLTTLACEKLDEVKTLEQLVTKWGAEPSKFPDAISLEYGELLQVNPGKDVTLLTFQKPDKSLVFVWVSFVGSEFVKGARTIPRK